MLVIPTGAKRRGGFPLHFQIVSPRDPSVRAGLAISPGLIDTLERFHRVLLRKFRHLGIRFTRFQQYSGISSPYHLGHAGEVVLPFDRANSIATVTIFVRRSEEHTSELQSHSDLVCRLLLEKKKKNH